MIKNPNWWEADQLAIYTMLLRSWTRDYREQIQIVVGCQEFEPGTSRFQIQCPKWLSHTTSTPLNETVSLRFLLTIKSIKESKKLRASCLTMLVYTINLPWLSSCRLQGKKVYVCSWTHLTDKPLPCTRLICFQFCFHFVSVNVN